MVSGLAQGVVKPGSNVVSPKQGLFGSEKKKKITICFQFSHFQGFVKNNFFALSICGDDFVRCRKVF